MRSAFAAPAALGTEVGNGAKTASWALSTAGAGGTGAAGTGAGCELHPTRSATSMAAAGHARSLDLFMNPP